MRCVVAIVFGPEQTLELPVDVQTSPQAAAEARDWFDESWVRLECESTQASGKVLLLDKVLSVTEALGCPKLLSDAELAQELARRTAQALEKPYITIDLQDLTVSF